MGIIDVDSKKLTEASQRLQSASQNISIQADTLDQVLSIVEGAWTHKEVVTFAQDLKKVKSNIKRNASDFDSVSANIQAIEKSARLTEAFILNEATK